MVVYEDNRTYGAGAEIVATIAEEAMFDLDAPIVRVGGPDIPAMPFADAARALLHGARARSALPSDARARPPASTRATERLRCRPFRSDHSSRFRRVRNASIHGRSGR